MTWFDNKIFNRKIGKSHFFGQISGSIICMGISIMSEQDTKLHIKSMKQTAKFLGFCFVGFGFLITHDQVLY